MQQHLIIVVPAYNEGQVIASTIAGVQAQLDKPPLDDLPSQVIVIDDGSSDDTCLEAAQLGVVVLRHPTNLGLGMALRTGFQAARDRRATLVVTFDADGQHHPPDIPTLVSPLLNDRADLVIGSRFLSVNKIPLGRRMTLWGANLVTWLLFGVWTTDSQSGLRALNHKALERIHLRTDRMEVSSEIVAEAHRLGLRIREVPICVTYSEYSLRKGQTFWDGFGVFYKLLQSVPLRRRATPPRSTSVVASVPLHGHATPPRSTAVVARSTPCDKVTPTDVISRSTPCDKAAPADVISRRAR
jgi:glycosyltransferase involved in cell wall biosynthesis